MEEKIRKLPENIVSGESNAKKAKLTPENEATDEEVEEFFAILRRMHEAALYMGGSRRLKEKERWTSFNWGDFSAETAVKQDKNGIAKPPVVDGLVVLKEGVEEKKEGAEENGMIDLNVRLLPERNPC